MFLKSKSWARAALLGAAACLTLSGTGKLVAIHRFADCVPHSVAEVASGLLYLGCDVPGTRLAVFDPVANKVVRYVPDLGGGGQTAANTNNGQYYAAINRHPGGPRMKVIDTRTDTLIQTIPAATGAHAVAVFLGNNQHRDVSVEDTVGQRPQEADDGAILYRNQRKRRAFNELAKHRRVLHSRPPVVGRQQQSRWFDLAGKDGADVHQ